VSRKSGKTAHHRAQVCPPSFFGCLGANLRIDFGYPSLRSFHASRELVNFKHALGETVD
jgi:hypothetical protein